MSIRDLTVNGQQVKINTKLTLGSIQKAKRAGAISNSFMSDIAKLGTAVDSGGALDIARLFELVSDDDILGSVYASYINVAGNNLTFEEFCESTELDFAEFITVYSEVIAGMVQTPNTQFATEFKKATPKNQKKSKKKYQK